MPDIGATLTAAAQRFLAKTNLRRGRGRGNSSGGWQTEAWDMYKITPEVRYAASWVANAMSGCTLYAAKRLPNGDIEPAPDGSRAAELVASIAGGPDGQSEMLSSYGRHLTVAGEGWTIIIPNASADSFADDGWFVVSTQEVKQGSDKLTVKIRGVETDVPAGGPDRLDPSAPVAIRIWDPAPWDYEEADSPVRSALVILQELLVLNAAVAAVARSRIVGRGILFVPQGTAIPGTAGQVDASSLMDLLVEASSMAIREPESAAATVPLVVEVPRDIMGQIQHLTFESNFDELAIKLRDECIRRFATAVDVPAEIMLGMSETSHWGVWAVQAEAVRLAVEPKLRTVAHAYTDKWLRPLLEAEGEPEADSYLVWYDTSSIRTSTNKGAIALEAFDKGLISAEAARRETGFDEADAPDAPDAPTKRPLAATPDVALPVAETQAPPATQPDTQAVAA